MKRLVFRVIPDHATRLAALKRGDVDVVYLISGELAEEVRRTPGLTLKAVFPSNHWLIFPDQFDPKSPWHDKRVRLAANLAIDRKTLNEAATLGLSKITGSIVPSSFDFYWPAPPYPHDPARARRLLTEAGYANGFDAGEFFCDLQVCSWGEAMLTDLKAVGIQLKLRPLERAAFFKGVAEKKYKNLVYLFIGELLGREYGLQRPAQALADELIAADQGIADHALVHEQAANNPAPQDLAGSVNERQLRGIRHHR